MKILGIDPALGSLGWGVVEVQSPKIDYIHSDVIKTKPSTPMEQRLGFITSKLRGVVSLHQPDIVAMEITFLNNNAASSLKLAYARGAIMSLVGELDIPYYEYAPNQIKKTIVGSGHADKHQVKTMVQMILSGKMDEISFDEADALAVAYTCSANI
ncbi:MAG: hypothetical protein DGJ47_000880 [Rickettsiaceae bacterium]